MLVRNSGGEFSWAMFPPTSGVDPRTLQPDDVALIGPNSIAVLYKNELDEAARHYAHHIKYGAASVDMGIVDKYRDMYLQDEADLVSSKQPLATGVMDVSQESGVAESIHELSALRFLVQFDTNYHRKMEFEHGFDFKAMRKVWDHADATIIKTQQALKAKYEERSTAGLIDDMMRAWYIDRLDEDFDTIKVFKVYCVNEEQGEIATTFFAKERNQCVIICIVDLDEIVTLFGDTMTAKEAREVELLRLDDVDYLERQMPDGLQAVMSSDSI